MDWFENRRSKQEWRIYLNLFVIRQIVLRRIQVAQHHEQPINIGCLGEHGRFLLCFASDFSRSRLRQWFLNNERLNDCL